MIVEIAYDYDMKTEPSADQVAAKQPKLTLDDISRFINENVKKTNKA